MRKVTFYLPDKKRLMQLVTTIIVETMEVSLDDLSLTCECGSAEIELAEKDFNATVKYAYVIVTGSFVTAVDKTKQ